jgi:hypothetical protein
VQKQKTLLSLLAITTATIIMSISPIQTATAILLRITSPDQGEKIPAGSFLTVTGTAAPSNATHTKCNVQLQTNQNAYKPVSPLGPAGTYTNWNLTFRICFM